MFETIEITCPKCQKIVAMQALQCALATEILRDREDPQAQVRQWRQFLTESLEQQLHPTELQSAEAWLGQLFDVALRNSKRESRPGPTEK